MVLDSVVGDPIYTVHDLVLGDLLVTTSVLSVDVSTLCDHASDYADVIELRLNILLLIIDARYPSTHQIGSVTKIKSRVKEPCTVWMPVLIG